MTMSGQQVSVRPRSVAAQSLRLQDPSPPRPKGARSRLLAAQVRETALAQQTCGHPPPSGALNSGWGRSTGGASRSAQGVQAEPAPSSLARTPLSPAASSTCRRGRPSPGRGCSGCDPYGWMLLQIHVKGSQPPFLLGLSSMGALPGACGFLLCGPVAAPPIPSRGRSPFPGHAL